MVFSFGYLGGWAGVCPLIPGVTHTQGFILAINIRSDELDITDSEMKTADHIVLGTCWWSFGLYAWIYPYGIPVPISIVCGLACGTLIGGLNGFLVSRVKLPPFIVTLGMWQIVLATNFLYSANETIRSQDIEAQAPLLQLFGA